MRWFERFRMAMLMLFRRQAQTARLNDELAFHLEQQIKENIARGLAPDEARYAALRTFGNPTLLGDEARSSWSWNWLEKLLRDLRYGARTLTRSPGFSVTAILVMALGIGATTSLFTIVRAVLLKPLPFRDPDKLVMVYEHFRASTESNAFNTVAAGDFHDWRQQTHGFDDMAARNTTALISPVSMQNCRKLFRLQAAAGTCSPSLAYNQPWAALLLQRRTSLEPTTWLCSHGACFKGDFPRTRPSWANRSGWMVLPTR